MVPEVKKCTVKQCFYYRDEECRAHAILVGSDQPICDTFAHSNSKSDRQGAGEVGACHVTQCAYNNSMYCHSCDDIVVNFDGSNAVCSTFRQK